MQTYFSSFGPLANLVSSFRESSQHVRKTCAWINTAQNEQLWMSTTHSPSQTPPKPWWNLDESGVFVNYLVPENLVGWVSFICRWFSNIFPWNIGTSQPASLESQGMIPRGYATKHSPKVYRRICPSIRLFLVYRLGLVFPWVLSCLITTLCVVSLVFDVGPGFWMVNKAATATTVVVIIQNLLAESRFPRSKSLTLILL